MARTNQRAGGNQASLAGRRPVVVAAAAAAICGWSLVELGGYPLAILALLLGCFLVVIVMRAAIGVYAGLAITLVYPLYPLSASGSGRSDMIGIADLLLAIAVCGFVAFSFRYLDLQRVWSQRLRRGSERQLAGQTFDGSGISALSGRWHHLAVALSLALLILWAWPLDSRAPRNVGLIPTAARMISVLWLVGSLWLILASVASVIGWRRLDADQAGVYVRTVFAEELDRDLSPIESRRGRLWRKHIERRV